VRTVRQWEIKYSVSIVVCLQETFRVGKRLRGEYLKAVLDTQRGWLTVYRNGRVFKRWSYKLLNK